MRAALVENKKMVVKEMPDPVPASGDVLVEIYATALNRADLLQKQGTYPSPAGWPEWPGLELAGKIIAIGKDAAKNSSFKVGDKVCALVGGGGYAEKIAVPYQLVMPIPKGLTMAQAAALPEAYATSYLNLFYEGKLQKGQTVYVAAGASGLASAAIPVAKAAGAYVVTSVQTTQQEKKHSSSGRGLYHRAGKGKYSRSFRAFGKGRPPRKRLYGLSWRRRFRGRVAVYGARGILGFDFHSGWRGNANQTPSPFDQGLAFGWQYAAQQNE